MGVGLKWAMRDSTVHSFTAVNKGLLDISETEAVSPAVTNPTLSESVALLIDGLDNMCREEREVLTAQLRPNSFDLKALDRDHCQFVCGVALVRVADVELALVLDSVGVAEIGVGRGDARRLVGNRGADEQDLAEFRFTWLAHGNGQRRPAASCVGGGGADEVTLARAQDTGIRLAGGHGQIGSGCRRPGAAVVCAHRE